MSTQCTSRLFQYKSAVCSTLPTKIEARILLVADQPAHTNPNLLEAVLSQEGHTVSIASSGMECLQKLAPPYPLPDILLLDLTAPIMEGLELCRQIRKNEHTSSIPIFFISDKITKTERLEGLRAGVVDYITKPIDLEELSARVKTQLEFLNINRLNLALEQKTNALRHTHAMQAITEGMVHNLNNILAGAFSYLELLKTCPNTSSLALQYIYSIQTSLKKVEGITKQLSHISLTDAFQNTTHSLEELINTNLTFFTNKQKIELDNIPIKVFYKNVLPTQKLLTQTDYFHEIFQNLVQNAWESYPPNTIADDRKIHIYISTTTQESRSILTFQIQDFGQGLPSHLKEVCFEPFVTSHAPTGRGLGLTIARQYAQNLNGQLLFENSDPFKLGTSILWHHPL